MPAVHAAVVLAGALGHHVSESWDDVAYCRRCPYAEGVMTQRGWHNRASRTLICAK
jgi:hypothetical protein